MTVHLSTIVTNINTGGQWIVIQTLRSRHGPFKDREDAEQFAAKLDGGEVRPLRAVKEKSA